jgi:hypothetical protein
MLPTLGKNAGSGVFGIQENTSKGTGPNKS